MVLSNAERQARHRARRKMLAERGEALVELLEMFRRKMAEAEDRIRMLEAHEMRVHSLRPGGGYEDVSDETVARERVTIAEYARLLKEYDPENATAPDEKDN
jgi:hypothetical protein